MTSNMPSNVIFGSFKKVAVPGESSSRIKDFQNFMDLAYLIAGPKDGGKFEIKDLNSYGPKFSLLMTYNKPFQGNEPGWERTPFFRFENIVSEDTYKTISAVPTITHNGKIQKLFIERHHQSDFAGAARSHLRQWAETAMRSPRLRSVEAGLFETKRLEHF
jgi:hypothetical protein